MHFWKDGISISDFEKLVTGFLLIVVVCAAVYRYLTTGEISSDIVYLTGIVGGLFIGRKVAKYHLQEKQLETKKDS